MSENVIMLNKIKQTIGGRVVIERKKQLCYMNC